MADSGARVGARSREIQIKKGRVETKLKENKKNEPFARRRGRHFANKDVHLGKISFFFFVFFFALSFLFFLLFLCLSLLSFSYNSLSMIFLVGSRKKLRVKMKDCEAAIKDRENGEVEEKSKGQKILFCVWWLIFFLFSSFCFLCRSFSVCLFVWFCAHFWPSLCG